MYLPGGGAAAAARRRPFGPASGGGACGAPKVVYVCLLILVALLFAGNAVLLQSRQCENRVTELKAELQSRDLALQEARERIGGLEALVAKRGGGGRAGRAASEEDGSGSGGGGAAAWQEDADTMAAARQIARERRGGEGGPRRGAAPPPAAPPAEDDGRDGGAAARAVQPAAAAAAPPAAPGIEPAPASTRSARAVIVFCYNRPDYLRRTLTSLLTNLPTYNRPHIYVSQDGDVAEVATVIQEFGHKFRVEAPDVPFTHLNHPPIANPFQGGHMSGYYKLAQHFGWGLNKLFVDAGHPRVIILEDDLEIATDFFDYFTAVEPLLDGDNTLLAASAWSDLGQASYASDVRAVYRSDFFPGLGWMLNSHAWEELGPKWPDSFWDDWLREPPQRKGRAFLRPEVSRSYTFGANGVSQAQFFSQYLENIKLNDVAVDWAAEDLSYLDKATFDREWAAAVNAAAPLDIASLVGQACGAGGGAYKAVYDSFPAYESFANRFGFITDVKAGVPRTAYQGVVHVRHRGCRKFLVPADFGAAA